MSVEHEAIGVLIDQAAEGRSFGQPDPRPVTLDGGEQRPLVGVEPLEVDERERGSVDANPLLTGSKLRSLRWRFQ